MAVKMLREASERCLMRGELVCAIKVFHWVENLGDSVGSQLSGIRGPIARHGRHLGSI